jgi:hypothetical protein
MKRYLGLLEETFGKISGMLQLMSPTIFLIVDSAPIVELFDMEASWGFTQAEENSEASNFIHL